jgi:hypothetical protein
MAPQDPSGPIKILSPGEGGRILAPNEPVQVVTTEPGWIVMSPDGGPSAGPEEWHRGKGDGKPQSIPQSVRPGRSLTVQFWPANGGPPRWFTFEVIAQN